MKLEFQMHELEALMGSEVDHQKLAQFEQLMRGIVGDGDASVVVTMRMKAGKLASVELAA